MARRTYDKRYEHLIPAFYPLKLIGAVLSPDRIALSWTGRSGRWKITMKP